MSRKEKDDELQELHLDRALSEMDVGITQYGDNNIFLEDNVITQKADHKNEG
jgi:hypothetical protein